MKRNFLSSFKLEINLYRIFPITLLHILPSPLCLPPNEYISYTANSYAVVFSPLYSAAFIIVSFFSTQSTFYRSRISFVPFFSLSFSLFPSVLYFFHSALFSLSLRVLPPFLSFQARPSSIQQLDSHVRRISIIL